MANQLSLGLLAPVVCKVRTSSECRDFRLLSVGIEWDVPQHQRLSILPAGL